MTKAQHSKKIMASYGVGNTVSDLLGAVLTVMLFAFYETEVGLNTALTGIAMIIFAIWDAVNDPIVGYISDRPYSFTKKWGRRFPFIVGSYFPMLLLFVAIFYPPIGASQTVIFAWLIVTTCLFDTVESIFLINFMGLFPDKFRGASERVTASAIGTYFTIFGVVMGGILPPMIIIFGEINSYVLMAWATVAIIATCFPFFVPGARDDKEVVSEYLENYEGTEKESLVESLKITLSQKNFTAYLVLILLYFTVSNTMSSSLFYYSRYVLGVEAETVSMFVGTMFTGAFIGVIIWLIYVRRTNNNRGVMIYSGIIVVAAAMVFSFASSSFSILAVLFVFGLGLGGFLLMMAPTFSDVIDESIMKTGQRNEGLFGGIRFFVTNFSRVLMSLILAVVHEFTGFVEASDIQPPAAIMGIRLHSGFIPALFMLVGVIFFWKYYDITPNKAQQIKEKLSEMSI